MLQRLFSRITPALAAVRIELAHDSQADISVAARVKCLRLIAGKAYPELATLVIQPGLAWVYASSMQLGTRRLY
jgi:hypothetical protein